MDPAGVLAMLHERGLGRVLVEGGGRLVTAFVEAGVVDRLYLTTAPVLIGEGVPGLRLAGTDRLADALRPPVVRRWLAGDDVVTELDLTAARAATSPTGGTVGAPFPTGDTVGGGPAAPSARGEEQVDVAHDDGEPA